MADIELFIHSAEIAGVFVGFGALIAVRSGAAMAVDEFNNIRWVVTVGIWVVIVALAPIFIASYGLDGHGLWLVSGLLALALFAVVIVVFARTPENQTQVKAAYAGPAVDRAKTAVAAVLGFWLPTAAVVLALVLVVAGAFPDQEQALYLSAVGLGLLMAATAMFYVVLGPSPSTAPDRLGPPASGGSGA